MHRPALPALAVARARALVPGVVRRAGASKQNATVHAVNARLLPRLRDGPARPMPDSTMSTASAGERNRLAGTRPNWSAGAALHERTSWLSGTSSKRTRLARVCCISSRPASLAKDGAQHHRPWARQSRAGLDHRRAHRIGKRAGGGENRAAAAAPQPHEDAMRAGRHEEQQGHRQQGC